MSRKKMYFVITGICKIMYKPVYKNIHITLLPIVNTQKQYQIQNNKNHDDYKPKPPYVFF